MRPTTLVAIAAGVGVLVVGVVLDVSDTVDLLGALNAFVWPVLAAWLLYRLLPPISDVIRSRAFEVELAGVKLSVQEALQQIPRQIDDLRSAVSADGEDGDASTEAKAEGSPPLPKSSVRRILWVDDRPKANVYEMKTLLDEGWEIERAQSTSEALQVGAGKWARFSVVVSDMGRDEAGRYIPDAGIQLVKLIHAEAPGLPIVIYTNRKGYERRAEALAAGATELTSSPIQLLGVIRETAAGSR